MTPPAQAAQGRGSHATGEFLHQLEARAAAELADLAGQPFALVDFPDHANVGDSAIWLGTTAFFRRHHRSEPRYVASISAFSAAALRRAHPEGPILIHGGGYITGTGGSVGPPSTGLRNVISRPSYASRRASRSSFSVCAH